jgi:putative endonuclease
LSDRQRLGRAGEELALEFLSAQGFRPVARRVHSRYGELDLVGLEGEELVFVEVKTRGSLRCGTPEEAWTREKRRRLWQTAAVYLRDRLVRRWRFDLVAVRVGEGEVAVRWYRNAWERWG